MKSEALMRGWASSVLLTLTTLLLLGSCTGLEEDFSCHGGAGFRFRTDHRERGAIIPRGDIIAEVGKTTKEVFCRFNSTLISSDDVYFATKQAVIPHKVVNSSTIGIEINPTLPEKYTLYCKLKRKKKSDKILCSQVVTVGYPPLNIENLTCVSINNDNVNCSWNRPYNPIWTNYSQPDFYIPYYIKPNPCPDTNKPFYTWCYWDKSVRFKLRDSFFLRVNASNVISEESFVHKVNIPEIVIPNKVDSEVSLIGPIRAKVSWNLTYPMDVFFPGLWHNVESRVKGDGSWENVTFFFYKNDISNQEPKRRFSVEVDLPYADTEYEFRVRIHTGVGDIKESKWSSYDILSVTAEPMPPQVAPETIASSFEVVEGLDMRDIFVNFKDVDERLRGGKGFHYVVQAFSPTDPEKELALEPAEVTPAYFKFRFMNFTEYWFKITAENEKGPSSTYAEITVPNSDCMPKKTEMFTVITSSHPKNKTFSLYWVPSRMPNENCHGSCDSIDSYTIFWCKRTSGNRCKEKLNWKNISEDKLTIKDLSSFTKSKIVIFEYNMTNLSDEDVYSFGIAANCGKYSSGIRWSSCIVDDSEPPHPPVTEVEALTNDSRSVLVKWNFKCMSISAVPVGFNISYCKSVVEDFGHCTSEVRHVEMNSPVSSETLITDLDAGYSYIFSVSVLSIIGEGSQSYPKLMKLREDIPSGSPLDLRVVTLTNTSVTLSWYPPAKLERRGAITDYQIDVMPFIHKNVIVPAPSEEGIVTYTLKNLKPFTPYKLFVSACNSKGCGYRKQAELQFRTAAGAPGKVENFLLDVSNWRLMWNLKECNSRNCSFEVQVPVNETGFKSVTVSDKDTLSLREVPCNYTYMKFAVRAKGQDKNGNFLYGNWSSTLKEPSVCPAGSVVSELSQNLETLVVVPIFYQVVHGILSNSEFNKGGNLDESLSDDYNHVSQKLEEGRSLKFNGKIVKDTDVVSREMKRDLERYKDQGNEGNIPVINHPLEMNTKLKDRPNRSRYNKGSSKSIPNSSVFRVSVRQLSRAYLNKVKGKLANNNNSSESVVGKFNNSVMLTNGSSLTMTETESHSPGGFKHVNSNYSSGEKQEFNPSQPLMYHLGTFRFNGGVHRNRFVGASIGEVDMKINENKKTKSELNENTEMNLINQTEEKLNDLNLAEQDPLVIHNDHFTRKEDVNDRPGTKVDLMDENESHMKIDFKPVNSSPPDFKPVNSLSPDFKPLNSSPPDFKPVNSSAPSEFKTLINNSVFNTRIDSVNKVRDIDVNNSLEKNINRDEWRNHSSVIETITAPDLSTKANSSVWYKNSGKNSLIRVKSSDNERQKHISSTESLQPLHLVLLNGPNKLNMTLNENFELNLKRKINGDMSLVWMQNQPNNSSLQPNHLHAYDKPRFSTREDEESSNEISSLLSNVLNFVL